MVKPEGSPGATVPLWVDQQKGSVVQVAGVETDAVGSVRLADRLDERLCGGW